MVTLLLLRGGLPIMDIKKYQVAYVTVGNETIVYRSNLLSGRTAKSVDVEIIKIGINIKI